MRHHDTSASRRLIFQVVAPGLLALLGCSDGGKTGTTTSSGGSSGSGGVAGVGGSSQAGSGGSAGSAGAGGVAGGSGGADVGGAAGTAGSAGTSPGTLSGSWVQGFELPGTMAPIASQVRVIAGDPAGSGDVYVGGYFTRVADTDANFVARWSPTERRWFALGNGVPDIVTALLPVSGTELYAGGAFYLSAAENRVQRWDGSSWTQLPGDFFGWVYDLHQLDDGRLLVATSAEFVDDTMVNGLAVWDGASWSAFGGGANAPVLTIEELGDELCVGGSFSEIGGAAHPLAACWDADNQSWNSLGDELPDTGQVYTLLQTQDGTRLAGGLMNFLDVGLDAIYSGVWQLDENVGWTTFHGGVYFGALTQVRTLAQEVDSGRIWVGGQFGAAGRYDNVVGHLTSLRVPGEYFDANIQHQNFGVVDASIVGTHSVWTTGGRAYAGGVFTEVSGVAASSIAVRQAGQWSALLPDGYDPRGISGAAEVLAFTDAGEVIAAGAFRHAGVEEVHHIARWDGARWHSLGPGLSSAALALFVDGNDVYAGGYFGGTADGNTEMSAVGRWDGTSWNPLGAGFDGPVRVLAQSPAGDIYAGGVFAARSDGNIENLARWDGNEWHAVAANVEGEVRSIIFGENDELCLAGDLRAIDGVSVGAVACRRAGVWDDLGGGVSVGKRVNQVAYFGGELIAVGDFDSISGVEATSAAAWNGTSWRALGELRRNDDRAAIVQGMATHPAALFITGFITEADGQPAEHLVWWDGERWRSVSPGLADIGEELAVHGDALAVGGSFATAGGEFSHGIGILEGLQVTHAD